MPQGQYGLTQQLKLAATLLVRCSIYWQPTWALSEAARTAAHCLALLHIQLLPYVSQQGVR